MPEEKLKDETLDLKLDLDLEKPQEVEEIERKDGFYAKVNLPGTTAQTNSNYGIFFIVRYACEVMWVSAIWSSAATAAGAVDLNIQRLTGTQGIDGGSRILKTHISLKGTANTVNQRQKFDLQNTVLKENDRLQIEGVSSPTLTSLDDLCVTVYLKRIGKGHYDA